MDVKSLYTPQMERDSCGIGFVAHLKGRASHSIVRDALTMLCNMEHRGARGADPHTGDGAGILLQIPHAFLKEVCDFALPAPGTYGAGLAFFPQDSAVRDACKQVLSQYASLLGLQILGYRKVPSCVDRIGTTAALVEPHCEQVFVAAQSEGWEEAQLLRRLYIFRKAASHAIHDGKLANRDGFYITSLSNRTLIYKGQLRTDQLEGYFPDLQDERVTSAIALVHSRFSTNTFPKWKLAQPFRYIAHNGEINTLQGNVNSMRSKEVLLESELFSPEELELLKPICNPLNSDSACLDGVVELLTLGGRSLPHAMMMLIPEAWEDNHLMSEEVKAFYEYHAAFMEPWDGPASICFTDGRIVGATLDRNGLRPSRYLVTSDDRVIMASEAGALPVDPSLVVKRGRLQPGRMFVADLQQGRIISDEELKQEICFRQPYRQWLNENKTSLSSFPEGKAPEPVEAAELIRLQQVFGYSREDLKVILMPMAKEGHEPLGSMGTDTPLAALSHQSQHLSNYFKQLFAQVSNPPIDPIRERLVMSLQNLLGAAYNILGETPGHCRQIGLPEPVLDSPSFAKIRDISHSHFSAGTVSLLFPVNEDLETGLRRMCEEAEAVVRAGNNLLIISDRGVDKTQLAIPTLMATGAVHHHLLRCGLRSSASLIVEGADIVETHHVACLIAYGAEAIYPYLALETLEHLKSQGILKTEKNLATLQQKYRKGIHKGLLKIFSKLGISTLQSYRAAQSFEILGLGEEVVETCFSGTVSRVSGLSFSGIEAELRARHRLAFPERGEAQQALPEGGIYQWKQSGEFHLFNPETIHLLQYSTRRNDYQLYKKYAARINDQSRQALTLRGLLKFKKRKPVPLSEVEAKEHIFRRFATGAMSFGSISHEAHSTLAIAMNRIGGKSNSGEGGEDEVRFSRKPNGDWERSAIKQVASARFGVTSHYLSQASELQIKMAQGAKPGEGGQLPGHKVDEWIGRVRHATPGVTLISPPPHHDIYSIEDLAQLIFDLKNANPEARINVKLVAKAGVGTIAAGVTKAHADVILISGHDGGTGASPVSSVQHAGLPWELGLAEAQQTLVKNRLRDRVTLQTDGQLRTGRDLAIAALLGAEEWGIATAALVVEGCIIMRKCHLNTCPVGVATQDPELRKLFKGKPEYLVNFFTFLAEDLREIMAELGFRSVDEMVGQVDALEFRDDIAHWKEKGLDLSPILYKEPLPEGTGRYKLVEQYHGLDRVLDRKLIDLAEPVFDRGGRVYGEFAIRNTDRAVGTMLSYEISRRFQSAGMVNGSLHFKFTGSAGQSFGAFGAPGLRLELQGEANDYVGKGLSGAQLIAYPDPASPISPSENVVIGNVAFYGATSGEAFIRGVAGERFCVRNSGVTAVVEGVGDHGCEYMTGGVVVVLGPTGRNFAAGMSGGVAYVYDRDQSLAQMCNRELVDLDPLDSGDSEALKSLIQQHAQFTGSRTAVRILTGWQEALAHFVKVMPRDFKAALEQRKKYKKAI